MCWFLKDAKDFGVLDCRVWDTGVVVLTSNFKLWAVPDVLDPLPRALADPGMYVNSTLHQGQSLILSLFTFKVSPIIAHGVSFRLNKVSVVT